MGEADPFEIIQVSGLFLPARFGHCGCQLIFSDDVGLRRNSTHRYSLRLEDDLATFQPALLDQDEPTYEQVGELGILRVQCPFGANSNKALRTPRTVPVPVALGTTIITKRHPGQGLIIPTMETRGEAWAMPTTVAPVRTLPLR